MSVKNTSAAKPDHKYSFEALLDEGQKKKKSKAVKSEAKKKDQRDQ